MKQELEAHIRNSSEAKLSLLNDVPLIEEIVNILADVVRNGGTIYACGNGGSTCDSMHLVEELVARYKRERPGIRAQHLCDSSVITCWTNDYDFKSVFERQVQTLVTSKDALIVFTTSGNSENILRALAAANKAGAKTIALLGRGGGKAKSLSQKAFIVRSDATAHIQECHIAIVHMVCEQLENLLYPPSS